ncbi:helix-turn-helix domain-containing protein [Curtobacterium sp. MMLR14_010]|uniref:helix-turn-helix domain-containing protein n=1 Tax=Curtobacterium sp. MMLR14_010 TaxID=1898743 RepID=UPI0034A0C839
MTVVDLANAAGLSVRGLQDAFQRDVKTSPLAYLREVRLAQVRSELQAAERRGEAVATIPRRWGCSHLGRFAAARTWRGTANTHERRFPFHTQNSSFLHACRSQLWLRSRL